MAETILGRSRGRGRTTEECHTGHEAGINPRGPHENPDKVSKRDRKTGKEEQGTEETDLAESWAKDGGQEVFDRHSRAWKASLEWPDIDI